MDLTWLQRFGAVSGVLLGLSIGVPGAVEAFTGETTATSLVLAGLPGPAADQPRAVPGGDGEGVVAVVRDVAGGRERGVLDREPGRGADDERRRVLPGRRGKGDHRRSVPQGT